MNERSEPRWTLDELGVEVKRALAEGYLPASSGRVRAVPDRRTIRYYTTLGLIDRPAEMRGRTAYYGPRHLLQLVAIKRLQAEGLTLAQVQQRLAGLNDAALEDVAQLPDLSQPAPEEPRQESFWSATPAELAPAMPPSSAPEPPAQAVPLAGIPLDPDATLLLTCERTPSPEDILAMRAAAGPLIELLERRGLLPRKDRS